MFDEIVEELLENIVDPTRLFNYKVFDPKLNYTCPGVVPRANLTIDYIGAFDPEPMSSLESCCVYL